jgi:crotonobetainyl-CoA:carnitine CoA-transferase CaiB-like acyl-CoA transferase
MRFASARPPSVDGWWEWSSVFQGVNTNKRGVTLDLGQEEGRNLVRQLIARSDAVMENFSPRVLDHFGITWETVQRLNPRAIMVRMPAFGLSGPWRDRTGFAQTMEQASGMAWMTGFSDGPPVIPRGPCDPLAGMHAAFALLAALEERARSGRGRFIEATMVEAALNVAAELVIEQSAYGTSLSRAGNRGPVAAPQGLYACQGDEQWLALAIRTDEDWRNLCTVLGDPAWARAPEMEDVDGRRLAHDLIDKQLAVWFLDRDLHATVEQLVSVGIPAAAVVEGARVLDNPQLRHRGFVEHIDHQLLGHHILPGVPFRLASRRGAWFERPAPRLGEHNAEVLGSLLGLSPAELERLAAGRVIGDQPGSG